LVTLVAAVAAVNAQAAVRGQTITVNLVKVGEQRPTKTTLQEMDQAYVGGKNTGHDVLSCTLTTKTTISCVALITLGANTINAHFTSTLAATSGKGTLDNGTGAFQNKNGTFTWKNLDKQGKRTQLVLHVS
jgi:hypothetical protein